MSRALAHEIAAAAGYEPGDVDALWVSEPAPPDVDEGAWRAAQTLLDLLGHDPQASGFLRLARAMWGRGGDAVGD